MQAKKSRTIRYTAANTGRKVKEGGIHVVSSALLKPGSANLRPKCHVKRGDTVVLISGPKKVDKKRTAEETKKLEERNAFKGTIGKVARVIRSENKVVVEGVNMMTHFVRSRPGVTDSGMVRKEAPIAASRVMLYDPQKKEAVRESKRKAHNL